MGRQLITMYNQKHNGETVHFRRRDKPPQAGVSQSQLNSNKEPVTPSASPDAAPIKKSNQD
jgi:hypothetical protein